MIGSFNFNLKFEMILKDSVVPHFDNLEIK